jgi:hypothetical protein|tara:strand:+ start:442 stop:1932 length:1491 start_codon:yes stop_codon:yes gene_type:complete
MSSRTRDLARILGKTEASNTTNAALTVGGETPALDVFDTLDSLPINGIAEGQRAFVEENNRLYITNGSGWYNVSLVNQTPTWATEPDGSYDIADSVTPLVITALATDSDNPDKNLLNQSIVTDSAQYMVTITNDSSVWTFTPKSADSIGQEVAAGNLVDSNGDFVYTFKWSDGISFVAKAVTIGYSPSGGGGFDRALFSGGTQSSGGSNPIEYMSISTGGDTVDFGDMNISRGGHTSFGNRARTVFANGEIPGGNTYTSNMEYVNPSTVGAATSSFGTNDTTKGFVGAVADLTRGVIGGGAYFSGSWQFRERMDYVTIDTTSSSSYFGGLSWGWAAAGSASSGNNTYGCFSGGVRSSDTQYIAYFERITIQTTGSASGFGSFSGSYARAYGAGFSDETYCFTAGGVNGSSPTYIDHVDKHSITTGGTGTNVASLSAPKYSLSATNNATSGVIGGGYSSGMYSNIEELNMSTDAIASTFGSLASAGGRYRLDATSGT